MCCFLGSTLSSYLFSDVVWDVGLVDIVCYGGVIDVNTILGARMFPCDPIYLDI